MKTRSGFFKQFCLFVPAGREELVALVDGGELRLVHDGKLLGQTQSAGVGRGVVGGQGGEGLPADGEVSALIFEAPDVTR